MRMECERLSGCTVSVIYEDQAGTPWFGTLGDGLNRSDRETERFARCKHDPTDPQSLGGSTVQLLLFQLPVADIG
jgi:hypothetical protein